MKYNDLKVFLSNILKQYMRQRQSFGYEKGTKLIKQKSAKANKIIINAIHFKYL